MRAVRGLWLWVDNLTEEIRKRATVVYEDFEPPSIYDPKPRPIQVEVQQWSKELLQGWYRLPAAVATVSELSAWGYSVTELPLPARKAESLENARVIRLRDAGQEEAFRLAVLNEGGVLALAPGRGKTVLALATIRHFEQPGVVLLDSGGLLKQWKDRAKEHLGLQDSDLCIVGDGGVHGDWRTASITLAMVKSLHNRLMDGTLPWYEFTHHFGTMVVDEAHHASASELNRALSLFHARRYGLTATPHTDGKERLYMNHLGGIFYSDREYDIPPTVHFVPIQVANSPNWAMGGAMSYTKMLDFCTVPKKVKKDSGSHVCEYLDRVCDLIQSLRDRGEKVFVISQRVRGSQYIKDRLPEAALIDGRTPQMARDGILKSSDLVVVSRKIGEEALDRPDLSAVVLLTPIGTRALRAFFQSGGRVARSHKAENKTRSYMYVPYLESIYCEHLAAEMVEMAKSLGLEVVDPPKKTATQKKAIDAKSKRQESQAKAAAYLAHMRVARS